MGKNASQKPWVKHNFNKTSPFPTFQIKWYWTERAFSGCNFCDNNMSQVICHNVMTVKDPSYLPGDNWMWGFIGLHQILTGLSHGWLILTLTMSCIWKHFLKIISTVWVMSQSLNASMRVIKSSLPWLKVLNSVFHRRLEYLSALKSKVINSSYTSFSLTSENLF